MDAVFGKSFALSNIISSPVLGAAYRFENKPDDPILNGPFGNIAGKLWGTHIYHFGIRENMIQDQAEVLSRTSSNVSGAGLNNSGYVNIFRHKTLNFAWVGNGMGTSSYYPEITTEPYHDPIRVTADDKPAIRPGYGVSVPGTKYDIYNSFLLANMVAWGVSVSNHTPPPGGY